jgi:hypothetical protein
MRAELQVVRQEREVVLISRAEYDGVELLARAVLEANRPAFDFGEQRALIRQPNSPFFRCAI